MKLVLPILPMFYAYLAQVADPGSLWGLIERGGLVAAGLGATVILWKAFRRSEEKRDALQKEMLAAINRQSEAMERLVGHLQKQPCILEKP